MARGHLRGALTSVPNARETVFLLVIYIEAFRGKDVSATYIRFVHHVVVCTQVHVCIYRERNRSQGGLHKFSVGFKFSSIKDKIFYIAESAPSGRKYLLSDPK